MDDNLVLTTVGTSIIDNYLASKEGQGYRRIYEFEIEGKEITEPKSPHINRFKAKISAFMKSRYNSDLSARPKGKKLLSAEIISLLIMQGNGLISAEKDEIVLLYSDTLEDKISAETNRDILLQCSGFNNIEVVCLTGVKGRDAKCFNHAINSGQISEILEDQISNHEARIQVICFSGGYKGILPLLTEFAKGKELDMYYLFEKSDDLIRYNYAPNHDSKMDLVNYEIFGALANELL